MKIFNFLIIIAAFVISFASCSEDFLDADNSAYLTSETAKELAEIDPATLDAYPRGMWAFMVKFNIQGGGSHDDFSFMSILHSTDMMCENITMMASSHFIYDYDIDNREYNYRRTNVNWRVFYTLIAKANEIISFFPEEPSSVDSKGLIGQAYAIRGMSYYYLIQLYQHSVTDGGQVNGSAPGIPMIFSDTEGLSEDETKKLKGRNTVSDVHKQIENDLTKAVTYLEAGYSRPSKMYINANVANGFLARYYLLSQQWEKAAEAAKKAHSSLNIMGENDLHDGFMNLANAEWMWGFDHNTETQTTYASFFSHISNLAPGYAGISYAPRGIDARLYGLIPESDYRKSLFNGPDGNTTTPTAASRRPYAALKFGDTGDWTMDYVYMRASEMVLIEAEAYARLGRGENAATALKKLMDKRDPQWNRTSVDVDDIYLQRRIELWGEGFGYFDLKRLNLGIDRNYEGSNHMVGYKHVVPAQDKKWIYQIPIAEIQENKSIEDREQNP